MPARRTPKIVIVGAGFGGLGAAIELRRHGFDDVTILERGAGLGGTWRFNTYPGAACDVPSHVYSFSFAQRRDWSQLCSPQPEILGYMEAVARDWNVADLVVPDTDVTSCTWDSRAMRWELESRDGRRWDADVVLLATGQLHQPTYGSIPGRETFSGVSYHSAQWNHEYDLEGRRVAVIGNGASAVQFVPAVAATAARVLVFQRSGSWFLPRANRRYTPAQLVALRFVPGLQRLRRRGWANFAELMTFAIRHPATAGRVGAAVSRLFMRSQLRDHAVRRRAWPDYRFGCKRILFSNGYLEALGRENVDLIDDPVVGLEAVGPRTASGAMHEVDCIIFATGFRTDAFALPMEVRGLEGATLSEEWASGPHAHLGMSLPSFPSLFFVYGPNTNTSGGSVIEFIEAQASYIRQAVAHVHRQGAGAIVVRRDVEAQSDAATQARFGGTAWEQCDSWYRNDEGRIVTNWPGYKREYEAATRTFDPAHYVLLY